MATLVERYVDPDATGTPENGQNWNQAYRSLYNWNYNESKNLVTADETHLVHCRSSGGTADTTEISVSGWTTDATRNITIQVDQGDRHDGKWNANKYRLEVSDPTYGALTINEDYVTVIGLQIRVPNVTANSKYCLETTNQSANNQINIKNCIIRGPGSDNSTYGFRCVQLFDADDKVLLRNCLIYDSGSHDFGYGIMTGGTGVAEVVIQNCTSVYHKKCVFIDPDSGTVTLTNVLASDHLASGYCFLVGGITISQNYCASEDDTANDNGGTGNRENQTFTYVDEGNDDFHLAENDAGAKDYGTDLSGQFTDDIDGQTRSGTWDIGADEYIAAFVELAGTIAAAGGLSGALKAYRNLAGAIPAQSGISGSLKLDRNLAGAIAAQSGISGSLKLDRNLAGVIAAQSGLSGTLEVVGIVELAGAIAAISTLAAAMKVDRKLAGAIAAQGGLSGTLTVEGAAVTRGTFASLTRDFFWLE